MKTITAITPQVKNASRCNVFLDGEFFCGMNLDAVVKNRLKVGMQISGEKLGQIQLDNERATALDKAMTHLSGSVKTEKQIRDFLRDKGYTPVVIAYVVDKLLEYGFLNDVDFAKRYVETYSGKKGVRLIKNELRKKGISEDYADLATVDVGSQEDAATALAEKFMRGKERDRKTVQKLYRHLLSKGFTFDDAKAAAENYLSQDDE